mmetsp:Transcript_3538/g.8429  ORF Transcript_3538/g.8429 Transcript_3538/m.8429 type:complete len:212 (+) Transcript_3538:1696-2331(+)
MAVPRRRIQRPRHCLLCFSRRYNQTPVLHKPRTPGPLQGSALGHAHTRVLEMWSGARQQLQVHHQIAGYIWADLSHPDGNQHGAGCACWDVHALHHGWLRVWGHVWHHSGAASPIELEYLPGSVCPSWGDQCPWRCFPGVHQPCRHHGRGHSWDRVPVWSHCCGRRLKLGRTARAPSWGVRERARTGRQHPFPAPRAPTKVCRRPHLRPLL